MLLHDVYQFLFMWVLGRREVFSVLVREIHAARGARPRDCERSVHHQPRSLVAVSTRGHFPPQAPR
jgi:hypothetical protein